ncbi:glycosyltransferase family 9 protein [Nakamurella endophytica]|nr:glycosyltransferase family 9 protein [Nakamurella endophytica]
MPGPGAGGIGSRGDDGPTGGRALGPGDVLVLRALGLGDALAGVAALRGVRRAWPDRRIVLAGPAHLGRWLQGYGLVDAVLPAHDLEPLALPPGGGHVGVDLHGRGPASHAVVAATRPERLVSWASPEAGYPDGPVWRRDEHEVDRWCRLVTWAGGPCGRDDLRLPNPAAPGDAVVVHPGAAFGSRRWPPDRWRAVVTALAGAGHPVLVTGSAAERDLCAAVAGTAPAGGPVGGSAAVDRGEVRDLSGRLSVPELAEVVGAARLVACGDTGVAHIATALGVPSVLLFGPIPPAWWGPAVDPELHTVLYRGDPAAPGDPHGSAVDPALARITVDEVLDAVDAQLGAPVAGR